MAWDPAVLRKYNTTGHFRLINQVRAELKDNPLVRPKAGQSVGEANRSKSLTRALEARAGSSRYRRATPAVSSQMVTFQSEAIPLVPSIQNEDPDASASSSFRDRLNAIDLR